MRYFTNVRGAKKLCSPTVKQCGYASSMNKSTVFMKKSFLQILDIFFLGYCQLDYSQVGSLRRRVKILQIYLQLFSQQTQQQTHIHSQIRKKMSHHSPSVKQIKSALFSHSKVGPRITQQCNDTCVCGCMHDIYQCVSARLCENVEQLRHGLVSSLNKIAG